jgi:hypothetical protein
MLELIILTIIRIDVSGYDSQLTFVRTTDRF